MTRDERVNALMNAENAIGKAVISLEDAINDGSRPASQISCECIVILHELRRCYYQIGKIRMMVEKLERMQ